MRSLANLRHGSHTPLVAEIDGEIVFREPTSDNVPDYAILSYTCGKEEVIFQDMEVNADISKTMNKARWRKLQFRAK
jgi:hypothetical protein